MNKFQRRIVTDGTVFRIEIRPVRDDGNPVLSDGPWTRHTALYGSVDAARRELEKQNGEERGVWTVVEY